MVGRSASRHRAVRASGRAAVAVFDRSALRGAWLRVGSAALGTLAASAALAGGGCWRAAAMALGAGGFAVIVALVWAHRRVLAATREHLAREHLATRAHDDMVRKLVVHDLKNPLAVILANVAWAQESVARVPGLESEAEGLTIAHAEGQRLSGMITDLLLVTRLERGELPKRLEKVHVAELLSAVARASAVRALAKPVRLHASAPADLVAWIDARLLRRLLENLVTNALRYTPAHGRIELAAARDGDLVRFAVRNTGPRIPTAARGHLFEMYATDATGEPQNCGLGLYLCRLVAEAHGGRISLVERADWNVSFEAELPAGSPTPERGGPTPQRAHCTADGEAAGRGPRAGRPWHGDAGTKASA